MLRALPFVTRLCCQPDDGAVGGEHRRAARLPRRLLRAVDGEGRAIAADAGRRDRHLIGELGQRVVRQGFFGRLVGQRLLGERLLG